MPRNRAPQKHRVARKWRGENTAAITSRHVALSPVTSRGRNGSSDTMHRRCACARAPASSPLASRYSSDSGNSLASTGTCSCWRPYTASTSSRPSGPTTKSAPEATALSYAASAPAGVPAGSMEVMSDR
ncbi:hypothetical protein G6F63_015965 [Rhizopus arrhizus]|nr:hypothetical protein G6F63_015965 [Rhizopus arrhizus]